MLLFLNMACSVENNISDEEYKRVISQIVQTMIDEKKQIFIDEYVPTKEKLLIATYGTDDISDGEKAGFYEEIVPITAFLENELSSSFDFTKNHLKRKDIEKLDRVEIVDIKDEQINNIASRNIYCEIYDDGKVFKIEVLGLYKTDAGWMIMSDVAPGYF